MKITKLLGARLVIEPIPEPNDSPIVRPEGLEDPPRTGRVINIGTGKIPQEITVGCVVAFDNSMGCVDYIDDAGARRKILSVLDVTAVLS